MTQGGWDEREQDSEDYVPLIQWWIMRATKVQTPTGGEGGGDEGMQDIAQQDKP